MTKSQLIPIALAFAVLSCSDTADTTPDTEPAPASREDQVDERDGRPSDQPAARTAACGIDGGAVLTGDGIGRLRVGASVGEIRRECAIVGDATRPGVEGTQERRIKVDFRRDTVDAVVVNERVWRIHVDGSAFRTAEGLGV